MKFYKSLLVLGVAAVAGAWMTGCSDDVATLENAKEVYIDISPSKIVLSVGDTLAISATVSNTEGQIIKTPVEWSLDDESVVQLLGDTAIVCVAGSLDRGTTDIYTTNLRATLVNGKYAIAQVEVQPGVPDGVAPEMETYKSYNMDVDEVWFTVKPQSILDDYVPEVELSNDFVTLLEPAIVIEREADKEEARVGVRFSSSQNAGECDITLKVGDGINALSAKCTIVLKPFVESSIWDPGTGTGPNDVEIRRMAMGELEMYRTFSITKTIDINSTSYAYAGVNVPGGDEYQIRQAMEMCKWEAVSGNSVLVTEMREEFLEQLGFDAILRVASGAIEGNTVFNFVSTDTILEVTFRVIDFKKQPVDRITTNIPDERLEMVVGEQFELITGVEPVTSFTYHRPVVTAEDPSIIQVGEYYGGDHLMLNALKVGTTNLVITANDKTLTYPVTVKEGVSSIMFSSANAPAAFEGQTITWDAVVTTSSGATSTFPITWSSSDQSVAVAAAGANPAVNGNITAKAAGTANITATVLNRSATAPIQVMAVPGNLTYTKSNTSGVLLSETGNDMRITFNGQAGESVEILLLGYVGQWGFDISDMSVVRVTYNGIQITPESGWIKGIDMNDYTTMSFELNFNIAGKKFTMKATDIDG